MVEETVQAVRGSYLPLRYQYFGNSQDQEGVKQKSNPDLRHPSEGCSVKIQVVIFRRLILAFTDLVLALDRPFAAR